MQRSGRFQQKPTEVHGELIDGEWGDVMDYEKMKALMEATREDSAAQRKAQVKEFPKPDSQPDWKCMDQVQEERIAA